MEGWVPELPLVASPKELLALLQAPPSKSSRSSLEQRESGTTRSIFGPKNDSTHPNHSQHGPKDLESKPISLPDQTSTLGMQGQKYRRVPFSLTQSIMPRTKSSIHPSWSRSPLQDSNLYKKYQYLPKCKLRNANRVTLQ